MASTRFTDVPAAGFQAILQNLTSTDFANLRQSCRTICQSTTQHVPYIVLCLSQTSSAEQLCQWYQATQQLQHVQSIHILASGTVAADVLEPTVRLLSERKNILELQFQSSCSRDGTEHCLRSACILTLEPLIPLFDQIQSLLLYETLTIADAAGNLRKLAAAAPTGGWKLQQLTLHARWCGPSPEDIDITSWQDVSVALGHLSTCFPLLRQMDLKLPWVYDSTRFETAREVYANHWLPNIAMVAALANAVARLRRIQVMTLTGVPEIWLLPRPLTEVPEESLLYSPADTAADIEAANALLAPGLITSVKAAAATFPTLEALGGWLVHHLPTLQSLQLQAYGRSAWPAMFSSSDKMTGVVMSWHQKQQHPNSSSHCRAAVSTTAATTAAAMGWSQSRAENTKWCMRVTQAEYSPDPGADGLPGDDSTGSVRSHMSIRSKFCDWLSCYSSRPASELMCHISSCYLSLNLCDIDGLADLLVDMKCLKILEVILDSHSTPVDRVKGGAAAAAVTAAAAGVKTLESYKLTSLLLPMAMPCDALFPLTAAAGGPGSILRRLELMGVSEAPDGHPAAPPHSEYANQVPLSTETIVSRPQHAVCHMTHGLHASGMDSDCPKAAVALNHHAQSGQSSQSDHENSAITPTNSASARGGTAAMGRGCSSRTLQPYNLATTGEDAAAAEPAAAIAGYGLFSVLQQLDGLRELSISYSGPDLLTFPVQFLPTSLEVLQCTFLSFVTGQELSGPFAAEHASATLHADQSDMVRHSRTKEHSRLQLKRLKLYRCRLSNPSILASKELERLTVLKSSWPGGWTAAAAAWPGTRTLIWDVLTSGYAKLVSGDGNDSFTRAAECLWPKFSKVVFDNNLNNNSTSSNFMHHKLAAIQDLDLCVEGVLSDMLLAGFANLRSVIVQDLSWLSVRMLQPTVQQFKQQNPKISHVCYTSMPRWEYFMRIFARRSSGS